MPADDRDRAAGEQEDGEPREQAARERMAAGAVVREMGIRWCSEHGPHERCHYNDKYDKAVAILAPLLQGKREAESFRASVCAMLGWGNIPPQETVERDINALKSIVRERATVIELLQAQLASANAERDEWESRASANEAAANQAEIERDAANARVESLTTLCKLHEETETDLHARVKELEKALAGKLGIDRLDHSGAPCSLGGENLSALTEARAERRCPNHGVPYPAGCDTCATEARETEPERPVIDLMVELKKSLAARETEPHDCGGECFHD